jgi:ribosomal protein L21
VHSTLGTICLQTPRSSKTQKKKSILPFFTSQTTEKPVVDAAKICCESGDQHKSYTSFVIPLKRKKNKKKEIGKKRKENKQKRFRVSPQYSHSDPHFLLWSILVQGHVVLWCLGRQLIDENTPI